jgi:hypothetical protein
MTNNTETKPTLTNLDKLDRKRFVNAVNDLAMVTESYASKVFSTSPDEDATIVDIWNLTMILEDAVALIAELRPSRKVYDSPDQEQMKFDNDAY